MAASDARRKSDAMGRASLDDSASPWPSAHEAARLRDPVELTQWLLARRLVLVESSTSTSEDADPGTGTRPLAAQMQMQMQMQAMDGAKTKAGGAADMDDDDGEDVDEENAGGEEVPPPTGASGRKRKESTMELELETISAALQVAKDVVDQLQLKMVLVAGEQIDQHEQGKEGSRYLQLVNRNEAARMGEDASGASGVPAVNAPTVSCSSCPHCRRSFSAFQRTRHCQSCGHLHCLKCIGRQQLLPTRFGFGDDPVRVCDSCSRTFQQAMDRYFDARALVPQVQQLSGSGPSTRIPPTAPISIPSRRSRLSSLPDDSSFMLVGSAPTSNTPATANSSSDRARRSSLSKMWFKGHLRAMHVGDRHPRRKLTSDLDTEWDGDEEGDGDGNGNGNDNDNDNEDDLELDTMDGDESADGFVSASPVPDIKPNVLPLSITTRAPFLQGIGGVADSSEGEDPNAEEEEDEEDGSDGLEAQEKNHNSTSRAKRGRGAMEGCNSKRTKLGRSASFDLASLLRASSSVSASVDPPGSPTQNPPNSYSYPSLSPLISVTKRSTNPGEASVDTREARRSSVSSTTSKERSSGSVKVCFDDSDIVDMTHRGVNVDGDEDDTEGGQGSISHLHRHHDLRRPAVVRFAVYDVGSKGNQSLKRSLVRFGRKKILLDRYSLEVDCAQGVVRVKSVFMHRFWCFRFDAVDKITFVNSGANNVAHVVVRKQGGHGYHEVDWEFGNEEERSEFRDTLEAFEPTVALDAKIRRRRKATSIAHSNSGDITTSKSSTDYTPPVDQSGSIPATSDQSVIGSTRPPSNSKSQQRQSLSLCDPDTLPQDSSTLLNSAASRTASPTSPSQPRIQLLHGEKKGIPKELPTTLLIGPAGDTIETSLVWRRLRGHILVTNYRVIFMPLERGHMPTFGATAYVPHFAIISAQVLYPGGRRPRSTRAILSASPPNLVLLCKDARVMRFELEGSPAAADEHTQQLYSLINRFVDASQRYRPYSEAEISMPPPMALDATNGDDNLNATTGSPDLGSIEGDLAITGSAISSSFESTPQLVGMRDGAVFGSPLSITDSSSPVLHPTMLSTSANSSVNTSSRSINSSARGNAPLERSDVFAFYHGIELLPAQLNGWHIYTDDGEFKRQITADPVAQPFLKYYQNGRGNICSSYPSKLLVPASMNSTTLSKVADFRAKNRLPVVTYYHQRNRCVLVRSGQPLLGNLLSGSSSLSDQLLLGVYRRLPEIINSQSHSAPSTRPIYIFDARKLKASTGNRLMGKGGVETPQDYPGAVVCHLNIANMYRMQSSYLALLKLVLPGGVDGQSRGWLTSVEATRWLDHVRLVLDGAVKIARALELEGSSVLVHCSDGWDRTSQLTCLAQLMIDPFYRTIRGFAVLVEKDWCAFGHKFAERLGGDRAKDPHRNKSSPVMFQFLDVVWQLQRQFPYAFEFNEQFLLHVANSLTSGLYGTFLYDSRLQREANHVAERTVSVWTPVLVAPGPYLNSQYSRVDRPIWPWTSAQMVKLWEGYFFQWHPKYHECRWVASLIRRGGKSSNTQTTTANGDSYGSTVGANNASDYSMARLRSGSASSANWEGKEAIARAADDSAAGQSLHTSASDMSTSSTWSPGQANSRKSPMMVASSPLLTVRERERHMSVDLPPSHQANTGLSHRSVSFNNNSYAARQATSGASSFRVQRQQNKPPPMNKIFLFKS